MPGEKIKFFRERQRIIGTFLKCRLSIVLRQIPLPRLQKCNAGSNAVAVGGVRTKEPEPVYIFVNGIAGIVIERKKEPKLMSPNHHLLRDEKNRFFIKRS